MANQSNNQSKKELKHIQISEKGVKKLYLAVITTGRFAVSSSSVFPLKQYNVNCNTRTRLINSS